MADAKISALTALTGANVAPLSDVLPIVDTNVTTTKKILVSELSQAMFVLGTEQASTSGTAIDFTGIPAWAKEITIMFAGVSTNGTSRLWLLLGDAGGFETTGYVSGASDSAGDTSQTAALVLVNAVLAAGTLSGRIVLSLEDSSDFTWVSSGILATVAGVVNVSAGYKATSAALTQIRITTANGTDTFDAGAINISYR